MSLAIFKVTLPCVASGQGNLKAQSLYSPLSSSIEVFILITFATGTLLLVLLAGKSVKAKLYSPRAGVLCDVKS